MWTLQIKQIWKVVVKESHSDFTDFFKKKLKIYSDFF